jgi:FKBP-type peptidyl-prolyl cis-trans isomerase (trigger factor)
MQVTEVAKDGLKRAYTVTVSAAKVAEGRDKRLAELAKDLRLPGFRPGKVPMAVVKQRYGGAVMGEVLEQEVGAATRKVVEDRGLRPALEPKIEVVSFADGTDLEFRVDFEVLPEIAMPDFAGIAVEKLIAEPGEPEIDAAVAALAERHAKLEDVAEPRGAAKGEVLVCDFAGRTVERPGADLLPADLLAGAATGAWPSLFLLDGASAPVASVAGTGDGTLDIALAGEVQAGAMVRVFLRQGGVPAAGLTAATFAAALGVVAGALPEDAQAAFSLTQRDAGRQALATAEAVADVAGGERARVALRFADAARTDNVLPHLELRFPQAASLSAVLRLSQLGLFAGDVPLAERRVAFAGGTGTDMPIEVAGPGFIPGFSEQLEGLAPGQARMIEVSFPAEYGAAELAGKAAEFDITAKALKRKVAPAADEAFATSLGLQGLDELKAQAKTALEREYAGLSRLRLKRGLLDALAAGAGFTVPEGMVEGEFAQIWQRVEADLKAGRLDQEDAGKDEATLRADYRAIAERRVRLGLLLSEIGRANGIQVSREELQRAMRAEAARYPGQEQQVVEFFRKNPQAVENLRAPIFEEKVVDFVLELAKVSERRVTPAELAALPA